MTKGFSRDKEGNVVLTMTRGDYDNLLIIIGAGMAALDGSGVVPVNKSAALVNRINAGSPDFTPFDVTPECGPVVMNNDQRDFLCMGCGVSVHRTRSEPYPEIVHKAKKKNKR